MGDGAENTRGSVDWRAVESTLAEIHRISPDFLEENVLIGGGASFFYRELVEKTNDRDFPATLETGEDRYLWLSKDIDFVGTPKDEIPWQLGLHEDESGKCMVNGVWVDSPDVGYTFDAAMARSTAIVVTSENYGIDFLVISPALLLKEKRALIEDPKKRRTQDKLHAEVSKQAIKLLLCKWVEEIPRTKDNLKAWKTLADETKRYAPDLLDDPIVSRRLNLAAESLMEDPIGKSVYHWIKHKIPAPLQ